MVDKVLKGASVQDTPVEYVKDYAIINTDVCEELNITLPANTKALYS